MGYLTPDRPSRTLSGGEVERVNLTGCLGTSLVDTLFVMDEPSVGLHPRDIDRLIAIIRSLVDAGNTVVVVEHDEAMIRAADHVIEIGPEPGARGGHVVFQGNVARMLRRFAEHHRRVFLGPAQDRDTRRAPGRSQGPPAPRVPRGHASTTSFRSTSAIPLRRFVCLSGVSGSGKSTLLDNVIHQGLLAHQGQPAEDPAAIASVQGAKADRGGRPRRPGAGLADAPLEPGALCRGAGT